MTAGERQELALIVQQAVEAAEAKLARRALDLLVTMDEELTVALCDPQ